MVLGLGVHLVAAGDGADLGAPFLGSVGGQECVERGFDGKLVFTEGGGQLVERSRFVGGVNDGLESGA